MALTPKVVGGLTTADIARWSFLVSDVIALNQSIAIGFRDGFEVGLVALRPPPS